MDTASTRDASAGGAPRGRVSARGRRASISSRAGELHQLAWRRAASARVEEGTSLRGEGLVLEQLSVVTSRKFGHRSSAYATSQPEWINPEA